MIVDSHIHLGYTPEFFFYDTSIKKLLSEMDRFNIDFVINAHSEALIQNQYQQSYQACLDAYEESNGRILSYHVYDPRFSKVCLELMEKHNNRDVFRGIKIHPSIHGHNADDPAYEIIWQYARDMSMPILSHTWALSPYNPVQRFAVPERFIHYIEKYPMVSLICGHAGGRYDSIKMAARLAENYDNVYLDIAGDVYACDLINYLIEHCTAEKILFASDMLWFSPASQLGMIMAAGLTDLQLQQILGENAGKLFGIQENGGDSR